MAQPLIPQASLSLPSQLTKQSQVPADQAIAASANDPSQPMQLPQPSGGKRGRKPGSKNKPKAEKTKEATSSTAMATKREYEFNSEDEHSSEPMTYEEKRQLSMDINMLTADKLSTYALDFRKISIRKLF
jgi:hypothetical protein